MTRDEWARAFLDRLGYPAAKANLYALVSIMQAETGSQPQTGAHWNPLNTTRRMPGSSDFNNNVPPVQNYQGFESGLEATVLTLKEHGHRYGPIRRHLRRGDAAPKTLKAWESSAWGTGGLALKVLPQVRDNYHRWADLSISQ